MFSYLAYGLCLHSELKLTGLTPLKAAADVFIRLGKVDFCLERPLKESQVEVSTNEVRLFWKAVGTFLVRNGSQIIIDADPGATTKVLQTFLFGSVLAVVLHQRGLLVLHAGSIGINGKAIAFLGDKGQGKSTLIASLHKRGHTVVSDDVTVLKSHAATAYAVPSVSQLKLWPDALAALGMDPRRLPKVHPDVHKRHVTIQHFSTEMLPLEQIYILDDGSSVAIESVPPQAALISLMHHSYTWKLITDADRASHLKMCSDLVNNVPLWRLKRPWALSQIPHIIRRLEASCA